jgi:hypothetical protein
MRLMGYRTFLWAQVLQPQSRVLFLDTDGMGAGETRVADAMRNDAEAAVIMKAVAALCDCGLSVDSVGITSPYRSQVWHCEWALASHYSAPGLG